MKDVLEKGENSQYFSFFDINWQHPDPLYQGKVMMPFLGNKPEEILKNHEIKLVFDEDGLGFSYYDNRFPASAASYYQILSPVVKLVEGDAKSAFQSLVEEVKNPDQLVQNDWAGFKERLYDLIKNQPHLKKAISRHFDTISHDEAQMKELLEKQHFRLAYWKDTEHIINYRRFFTVNDLICLNMSETAVFEEYHRFIQELVEKKMVQGLRVDHIDGLLDPVSYLQQLRELVGDDVYLVVEKILEHDESLPSDWPIQGTTGYDFLGIVNHLLTNSQEAEKLAEFYKTIHASAI